MNFSNNHCLVFGAFGEGEGFVDDNDVEIRIYYAWVEGVVGQALEPIARSRELAHFFGNNDGKAGVTSVQCVVHSNMWGENFLGPSAETQEVGAEGEFLGSGDHGLNVHQLANVHQCTQIGDVKR